MLNFTYLKHLQQVKAQFYIFETFTTSKSSIITYFTYFQQVKTNDMLSKKKKHVKNINLIDQLKSHNGILKRIIKDGISLSILMNNSILWTLPSNALQAFKLIKLSSNKYKRTNHFPNMKTTVTKNHLCLLLKDAQLMYGQENDFSFVIHQYALPLQLTQFIQHYNNNLTDDEQLYICKPSKGMQGEGIFLLNTNNKPLLDHLLTKTQQQMVEYNIQVYIKQPLLYQGYKFDFRVYCLLDNIDHNNFRIYVFHQGLVRCCSQLYDLNDLQNTKKHLCNYTLNKDSANSIDANIKVKCPKSLKLAKPFTILTILKVNYFYI